MNKITHNFLSINWRLITLDLIEMWWPPNYIMTDEKQTAVQKKDDGKNLMLEQNNIYHMSNVISRTSPHNFIKVKEVPWSAI